MSKIQKIYIKNLKAIEEQELDLNGCSAIITAGNNKGKTTLLNLLPDRLRSEKVPLVLRTNETEGVAELELTTGEKFIYEVKEGGKEKLTFITKEGIKTPAVREISKRYFPEKFNIDIFMGASSKEQYKMLQKIFGIDLSVFDKQYKTAYQERAIANKVIQRYKDSDNKFDDSLPKELLDSSLLNNEFKKSLEKNAFIMGKTKRRDDILLEINQLTEKLNDINTYLWENNPEDIRELEIKLKSINDKNIVIEKNNRLLDLYSSYKDAVTIKDEQQNILDEMEEKKQDIIKACSLPDGITMTDSGIFVDGFPLDNNQISLSKRYITALKLGFLNLGEVKSLYFDASSLDKISLLEIKEWADKNDCQLLIEKPDFDGGEIQYEIINDEELT